ncbi:MAG TPA: glucose-1-phosphate cytidylyltransferase [Candidatus Acetatifactor stercoripullorum]|uniref:Glucose-1-phosphate cytidylyltransferase n=1 Tax=Candidatus Acetatifactor stercoripullorum TaxID=2838414 RepID=A0A9D1UBC0_9FIRM|nr:glucose-1-phosphate cytidylyltransferase [uncultured Acetatifactor sp.]HIW80356.1 glucose-1-phosphate cytidylyltransferase [Candidatus Acetatifactor stercoripullorum]
MKVVILAGGMGTRISEESHLKPKPMIEIGEKPILWHIMKEYYHYGFDEFIICCGYKQHMIKQWVADYYLYHSDVTFDFSKQDRMTIHDSETEKWKVTVVDTGLHTLTGGRIKRIQKYIGNETFMLTYGDGVSSVNIRELAEYHRSTNNIVTLTAALVEQRFGVLSIDEKDIITSFREKAQEDAARINAGYMVLEPEVFDYLPEEDVYFEQEPLKRLAADGKLGAYKFDGFWHPMDTMRDKEKLEKLWAENRAPWKIWQ